MSWRELLNQKKDINAEELKKLLFNLVESKEQEAFEEVCTSYRNSILANFNLWRNVPSHLRFDSQKVSNYAEVLIAIANWFDSKGDSQLLDLLEGANSSDNPLLKWENTFEKADEFKVSGKYSEAIKTLEELVLDMRKSKGSAVENYLPMVYGAIAENYFRLNEYELSYDFTHLALEGCQNNSDAEGVISYTGNLSEICKKQNKMNEAINWIIISTNIMLQIGQIEEAIQIRKHCNIEPVAELITLDSPVE